MVHRVIAVDGPAGAGKSTVARLVAEALGYQYIDTGAMYRAVTYKALESKADLDNGRALGELTRKTEIEFLHEKSRLRVLVDGRDVTKEIRDPLVSSSVSKVSCHTDVRQELVRKQREMALSRNVVMDGRDIGTVVFPNADVKIFLTASLRERARRRYKEVSRQNKRVSMEEIEHRLEERDRIDSHRDTSPLRPADDAQIIDTTDLTIDQVVSLVLETVRQAGRHEKQ